MIEEFQEWYQNRHDFARRWKEENPDGKVLGYFCTYVPEEILYAANILPVRILGSHEPPALAEHVPVGNHIACDGAQAAQRVEGHKLSSCRGKW